MKEDGIGDLLKKLYTADFTENQILPANGINEKLNEVSSDDIKFMNLMNERCSKDGDHYQLPLPFRKVNVGLPNNRWLAERRLEGLKRKLQKDGKFHSDYQNFMNNLFQKGYAREAVANEGETDVWYIPHHGVYHPHKPEKIRVVFDCSSECQGRSLNKELLSGPDLTNQIVGVLERFRENHVAFMADIESMFYQVKVTEEHKRFLKFLWWKDGNYQNPVVDCEMNVHVFGATSSPGCSNFALKKTSIDYKENFGEEAAEVLQRNFYVDDLLKSVETEEKAVKLIKVVKSMCKSGGFNLTKFNSNSKAVLETIPICDRKKVTAECSLKNQSIPIETTLGILWNIDEDVFTFKVELKEKPNTRRGMLSTLSTIYDPLGFVAPFILQGRKILQHLCHENQKWDQTVNRSIQDSWEDWKTDVQQLKEVKINRCFLGKDCEKIKHCSLHHFSDASETGYGQVTYIRTVDQNDKINCNIVMAKSRVAPLKFVSVPRLELTAATLAVKISVQLKQELDIKIDEERFWTDSKVVLAYLQNNKKRFKTYVANRVHQIKNNSDVSQWYYIQSNENPADDCSRGLTIKKTSKVKRWFTGPEFLWRPISTWKNESKEFEVDDNDSEVKVIKVNSLQLKDGVLSTLEERISSWSKMKRVMGYILLFINKAKPCGKIMVSEASSKETF